MLKKNLIYLVITIFLLGCESEKIDNYQLLKKIVVNKNYKGVDLTSKVIKNKKSVYISPQCYTKTKNSKGEVFNPCYSCHINSTAPNYIDDYDLQSSYAFSINSAKNPFTNSFKNRTNSVEKISDEEILEYINQDNYKSSDGKIILKEILKSNLPKQWDMSYDGKKDGIWSGYIPDCHFNFDEDGFDRDKNGIYSAWRVFAYRPFLGTFWPTNGSTDDVMIRLPKSMQKNQNGTFSLEVYKINLAIVESMVKQKDVELGFEVNEDKYGVDLNHNEKIDKTSKIVFKWNIPDGSSFYPKIVYKNFYVGLAKSELQENKLHIAPGLYPEGTEFLHSVRYIGINKDKNSIEMSKRMKELRYSKKLIWNSYAQLSNAANEEIKEGDAFPDRLRLITGDVEKGVRNGQGWLYQGFIEDKKGDLRPQTYEESLSCIGCHSGIGATTDSSFAFPRKFKRANSWYHWSKKSLVGTSDKVLNNSKGEYAFYLENNKAGDEFRDNDEVKNRFFNKSGNIIKEEVDKIADDITYLIFPSVKRALNLNKAYKVIVDEQSFIYGKDAHIKPLNKSVYDEVQIDKATGIEPIILDR